MREYHLHGTDYEMKVLEVKDDGDSVVILQTIVEEGETAEKKYRINLGVKNPLTQIVFASEDAKEGPKAFSQKRKPDFKRK